MTTGQKNLKKKIYDIKPCSFGAEKEEWISQGRSFRSLCDNIDYPSTVIIRKQKKEKVD